MEPADWPRVAELIRSGTNAWYERNGRAPIFGCGAEDVQLFCRVYEALDPGCCVVAEDQGGRLLGSCFYHPRPTHVSLGIMNSAPEAFGRGVARRLLDFVIEVAEREGKPLRLVSSALNLDSYSLYNRAGFVPYAIYQDLILPVPERGLGVDVPPGLDVRTARAADAPAMAELERAVAGIERSGDYRYFLRNDEGIWHASVVEDEREGLRGFLVSVGHAASRMLGPGIARDDEAAIALIAAELDQHRGQSPVWLVPAERTRLVQRMYEWGARNCELHLAQVRGHAPRPDGVVLPTFMPETG